MNIINVDLDEVNRLTKLVLEKLIRYKQFRNRKIVVPDKFFHFHKKKTWFSSNFKIKTTIKINGISEKLKIIMVDDSKLTELGILGCLSYNKKMSRFWISISNMLKIVKLDVAEFVNIDEFKILFLRLFFLIWHEMTHMTQHIMYPDGINFSKHASTITDDEYLMLKHEYDPWIKDSLLYCLIPEIMVLSDNKDIRQWYKEAPFLLFLKNKNYALYKKSMKKIFKLLEYSDIKNQIKGYL